MRLHTVSIMMSSLALGVASYVSAQTDSFAPALFTTESRLHQIEISPRDLDDTNAAAVRCQAFVETDGTLTAPVCDMDVGLRDRSLIRTVLAALEDEVFLPASVDDQTVRVLMNFAVFFSCNEEQCAAIPVPHHGYHIGQFGLSYVAPQAILSDYDWYDGFGDRMLDVPSMPRGDSGSASENVFTSASRVGAGGRPTDSSFTATVSVDADGIAQDSCIFVLVNLSYDDAQQRNLRKLESIVAALGESEFIPGVAGGQAVPMNFYESNKFVEVTQILVTAGTAGDGGGVGTSQRAFAGAEEAPELYCER